MKYTNKILFVLALIVSCILSGYGQTEILQSKTWSYKKVSIIYQQDTLVMYNSDSTNNVWYLGRVSFAFNVNHTYNGTTTEGDSRLGSWSIPNAKTLIVDRDTNEIEEINTNSILVSGRIVYSDDSVRVEGKLQTLLYVVPPIISSCESLKSGDWNTTTTWSCGHIPTIADLVIINKGHTITISNSNAKAQRLIYNGGSILVSAIGVKIFLNDKD